MMAASLLSWFYWLAGDGFWARYTADMPHRHVLLAYGFAWAIQLVYLGFVLVKSRTKSL